MSDTTTQADTQAVEADQSQADTSTQAEAVQLDEAISLEEAKKLRSEAKNLRTRLKEAETKLSAHEGEKLSETQKLQKKVEELTGISTKRDGALKTLLLQGAVAELKDQMGLRSTKSITRLIDSDALEFDLDNMQVTGVDEELKRLKKDDPDLFITGGTDGGRGGTGRAASFDMNTAIRRQAGRA